MTSTYYPYGPCFSVSKDDDGFYSLYRPDDDGDMQEIYRGRRLDVFHHADRLIREEQREWRDDL